MLIPFGYIKELDEYAYIDDVDNGLACNCICPSCDMELEARQGNEREHHFKHYEKAEKECAYSYWVSVRSMAKQILQKAKYINIDKNNLFDRHRVALKKVSSQIEIYQIDKNGKNHGFDFELDTSIGSIYIYFLTPEEPSDGRERLHYYNKPDYFRTKLILEIDLESMKSNKNNNAKEYLQKLIHDRLDTKEWITASISFIRSKLIESSAYTKKTSNKIYRVRHKVSKVVSEPIYEVDKTIPSHKKTYVEDKHILALFGLLENELRQEDIRAINTMTNFYQFQLRYDRSLELTEHLSIIGNGRNLTFISYKNEFYGLAKINYQLYIYQVYKDRELIYIGKAITVKAVAIEIDKFLYELENAF